MENAEEEESWGYCCWSNLRSQANCFLPEFFSHVLLSSGYGPAALLLCFMWNMGLMRLMVAGEWMIPNYCEQGILARS